MNKVMMKAGPEICDAEVHDPVFIVVRRLLT